MVDPTTSVTLIELFRDEENTILIQDFANGGSLNQLLDLRQGPLPEAETQLIIRKVVQGLNSIYEKNIIHRDLNINNVVIHLPKLEPTGTDLLDPISYLKRLAAEREALLSDLTKVDFQVKIIDYGLSKLLFSGMLADTPHGTIELIAPEVLETGYDQRVDVWGVGVMFYMLIALDYMFDTKNQPSQGKWCISMSLDYSIEALRFINETVQYDRERRPFPNKLLDHPYFKINQAKQKAVNLRLDELKSANLMCL